MRSIRVWLKTYDEEMELKASERGRHSKTMSPIIDPNFRQKFCTYVKDESRKPGANKIYWYPPNEYIVLRTSSVNCNCTWVNSELGLSKEEGYSSSSMKVWLHRCGFQVYQYCQ